MKTITIVLAVLFMFAASAPVFAAENVAKDAAEYTGNVVTGSVNTVGEAVDGTVKTGVSPFVAFWRSITGRGNPDKIVTEPLNQGGKTVYDATVNTGKTVVGQKK